MWPFRVVGNRLRVFWRETIADVTHKMPKRKLHLYFDKRTIARPNASPIRK
jgi:hypothetical protein